MITRLAKFITDKWHQSHCLHLREYVELQPDGSQAFRADMVQVGSEIILDDWQAPEPHPHPKFSHRCRVQRQPIAALCHCKRCGKLWIVPGYNQRDVEKTLPGFVL